MSEKTRGRRQGWPQGQDRRLNAERSQAGPYHYTLAVTERPAGIVSYFAAIEKKHGKPIDEWFAVLEPHRDFAHMEMVRLLKADYGMGHGHANAIVGTFRTERGIT